MDNREDKNQAIERNTFSEIFANFIPGWISTIIDAVFAYFTGKPKLNNQGKRKAFNFASTEKNVLEIDGDREYAEDNLNIPREAAFGGDVGNRNYVRTGGTYINSKAKFGGKNQFT